MRRRRAFTLVEAIVAIVILGIALPPMLLALAQAHRDRISPAMASQARWIAIEKLEDVLADRSSPTRGWDFVDATNYPDESSVPGSPGYSRRVGIVETGPDLQTSGTGYKTVTVTVEWTHTDGQTHSVVFATVATELPS